MYDDFAINGGEGIITITMNPTIHHQLYLSLCFLHPKCYQLQMPFYQVASLLYDEEMKVDLSAFHYIYKTDV